MIQTPSSQISWELSAIGMNSDGGTLPKIGWVQRISASKPVTRLVARSIWGW